MELEEYIKITKKKKKTKVSLDESRRLEAERDYKGTGGRLFPVHGR
jgi:hypothetical protein